MSTQEFIEGPRPGSRVDDFTVAYRIARGMSADVFAVWHHALRTPLVCKRLRPEDRDNRKWRSLLRAEGAALARLGHPGVVRLFGQDQRAELPYLLLEHVGSKTLRDRLLEGGPLDAAEAIVVVQHVGAAVAYAHARGYLHRDLKPSNIVVRAGRPVLLDFGVVWRWSAARRPPDRSGTPQYLAPEQIVRDPLTPRTDVYGLGLLLFELLTGRRPFPKGERYDDPRAPLAARYPQLTAEPPTLASAGAAAPRELQQVISRATARDPRERFATAEELLVALDRFAEVKVWPGTAFDAASAFLGEEIKARAASSGS